MTIPDTQTWLTAAQVADAFGKTTNWVYEQIKLGRSNRSDTTGIPARMVRRVGGSVHVHRTFVFPEELQPVPANIVALPQPQPVIDEAALARAFVDELIARLVSGDVARRTA